MKPGGVKNILKFETSIHNLTLFDPNKWIYNPPRKEDVARSQPFDFCSQNKLKGHVREYS